MAFHLRLRFTALLLGLGALIGLGLLLTGAALWLFYLAPVLTVPILIPALRVWGAIASVEEDRDGYCEGSSRTSTPV
jgi:hypothetical protein